MEHPILFKRQGLPPSLTATNPFDIWAISTKPDLHLREVEVTVVTTIRIDYLNNPTHFNFECNSTADGLRSNFQLPDKLSSKSAHDWMTWLKRTYFAATNNFRGNFHVCLHSTNISTFCLQSINTLKMDDHYAQSPLTTDEKN